MANRPYFLVSTVLLSAASACSAVPDDTTAIEARSLQAPAMGANVDIDGDGRPDGTAIDTDEDGLADALDTDGDGTLDGPLPATTTVIHEDVDPRHPPTGGTQAGAIGVPSDLEDRDSNGFTVAAGDCRDDSAEINPGAYDFPGNEYDEDCSGTQATAAEDGYTDDCDYFTASPDPADVLCLIFDMCGPRAGEQKAPAGFPKGSATCADQEVGGPDTPIFNGVALEVKVRAPTNARSFAFDSTFYTYEYPSFLCQQFNDFFIVTKDPRPELIPDSNVLFDSQKDPIGVNTSLLAVCTAADVPKPPPKAIHCAQGAALLQGTGFGAGEALCNQPTEVGGASTGWLNTTVPVSSGEVITLRFAIWDTGDALLDSTALIDNFVWSVEQPKVETNPIVVL